MKKLKKISKTNGFDKIHDMILNSISFAFNVSTWSFINEIKGDTTMAMPSLSNAGS